MYGQTHQKQSHSHSLTKSDYNKIPRANPTRWFFSTPIVQRDIQTLWVKMTAAFGHKFIKTYGTEDTGVWYEALSDLTQKALEKGFKKMLHDVENIKPGQDVWPPNAKEFRAYCLMHREEFGLPATQNAFLQVMDARYMETMYVEHTAVYIAALYVGYNKLTSLYAENYYSDYQLAYDILCQAIMNGLVLPNCRACRWDKENCPPALEPLSEETIKQAIIELADQLTIRNYSHA